MSKLNRNRPDWIWLIMIGLVLALVLVATSAYTQDFNVPPVQAPTFEQPEDSQETTVTVGEMKRALWYHDQYVPLREQYVKVSGDLDTVVKQRDAIAVERDRYRIGAIGEAVVLVVVLIIGYVGSK